jgi:hypothetical protein
MVAESALPVVSTAEWIVSQARHVTINEEGAPPARAALAARQRGALCALAARAAARRAATAPRPVVTDPIASARPRSPGGGGQGARG